eukprot:70555-Chlamydomonas_euryale.AAC.1
MSLSSELAAVKSDAARTTSELSAEAASLREALAGSTTEAQLSARRLADARRALVDLNEQLSTERSQLHALALDRARIEGLQQSSHRQIGALKQQLDGAQAAVETKGGRVVALEAEAAQMRVALERANAEAAMLGSEKARLTAELLAVQRRGDATAAAHAAAMAGAESAAARAREELSSLRETHDTQQALFHDTLTAATETADALRK